MHQFEDIRRSATRVMLAVGLGALLAFAAFGWQPPSHTSAAALGITSRVSMGNGSAGPFIAISGDGRFVAFTSDATDLTPDDTNGFVDIFVYDRQLGSSTRVSVDSAGNQANSDSMQVSISADGRFVAFTSQASTLVPDDTNGSYDVFVHDRQNGATTRVSIASAGNEANSQSYLGSISADGRFVAFQSVATNLVPGDTNGFSDVFVHDRQTRTTSRVSIDGQGNQANGASIQPSISSDGSFIAFVSGATNLVPGDTNVTSDVFVHERQIGALTRVSVRSEGIQANMDSSQPAITADGRFVAFISNANNLVPYDTNHAVDVFVHDRQTHATTRVSVDSAGNEARGRNAQSNWPAISADGRFVAFHSWASNLVTGDTNQTFDVFVHDRQTGVTTRASVDSAGKQGNLESLGPTAITDDGRFVAFASKATNLVSDDTNAAWDVFVRERLGAPSFEFCGGKVVTTYGTASDDIINGTSGADVIAGFGGNDTIHGLGGNDFICGGDGDDAIYGDSGNDKLYGEKGNDTLSGGDGKDTLAGSAGNDVLNGEAGNDSLKAGGGDDIMDGGAEVDTCDGGSGTDTAANCETVSNMAVSTDSPGVLSTDDADE